MHATPSPPHCVDPCSWMIHDTILHCPVFIWMRVWVWVRAWVWVWVGVCEWVGVMLMLVCASPYTWISVLCVVHPPSLSLPCALLHACRSSILPQHSAVDPGSAHRARQRCHYLPCGQQDRPGGQAVRKIGLFLACCATMGLLAWQPKHGA